MFLSYCHDNTVKVWDVSSGREERTLSGHTDRVNAVFGTKSTQRLGADTVISSVDLLERLGCIVMASQNV